MAKSNPSKASAESAKPAVDERSRRAFLDELEGRVNITEEKITNKRRVKIETEADQVVAPIAADKDELAAVLPEQSSGKKDQGTFLKAKRQSRWWLIILILVALAAVTAAGWFFFNRGEKFDGNNVGLSIVVPEQVASGDTVNLIVKYHNEETVDLKNVEVALLYPDGFTVTDTSVTATNDFKNAFTINQIKSGQVGEINISGKLIGAVGSAVTFSGTLSFQPANFNSDFQVKADSTVKIASSSVGLSIDGPKNMSPNGSAVWTINYTNTVNEDLDGLRLEVTFPTGMTVTKSDPKPTEDKNIWRLPTLKAGAKGAVTITATVTGAVGDSVELKAALGLVRSGTTIEPQAESTLLTALVETGLSIGVAANGSTESNVIKPADSVTYTIRVENRHDAEIKDVTLKATFSGSIFNLAGRTDSGSGTLKEQTLTWTKSTVTGLASIKPNETVTINLTVPTTAPTPAKADKDLNPQGAISVAVSSADLPTGSVTPTVLTTKVQTIMALSAEARYYTDEGVALGTGPVPPKVGSTTAYRVIWTVTSTTSDVQNFTVSAALPTSVIWTGKNISRDAGDITFDPASRMVSWTINKVPGGTGSRYPSLTAQFEVSVTPIAGQVGADIILTDPAMASGTDGWSGQKLSAIAESLTTDVPNDPHAGGEGKVIP